MNKREIGKKQEERVVAYLQKAGYDILCVNYRCKSGEIDIIAKDQEYLVFIEVKYRSGLKFGSPEEAVDLRKQMKICKTASYYLAREYKCIDCPIRFDIASVTDETIYMITNAFEYR